MTALLRRYNQWLLRYPCKSQAINTGVLMCAGDMLAQFIVERKDLSTYDPFRTARFLFVGFCLAGPGMHLWYSRLDRFIKGSRTLRNALKKTAVDQAFFMPFYLAVFIMVMAVLRREKSEEISRRLSRDFQPMLITSYGLWPAVQLINFWAVPLHLRIPVINVVGLAWNTYISWKAEHIENTSPTSTPVSVAQQL